MKYFFCDNTNVNLPLRLLLLLLLLSLQQLSHECLVSAATYAQLLLQLYVYFVFFFSLPGHFRFDFSVQNASRCMFWYIVRNTELLLWIQTHLHVLRYCLHWITVCQRNEHSVSELEYNVRERHDLYLSFNCDQHFGIAGESIGPKTTRRNFQGLSDFTSPMRWGIDKLLIEPVWPVL